MEFLRRLFESTRGQLSGLTVSQRLAIGMFVVIIAASLIWLMQWAGEPDLVPLFDNPIAQDEATPILNQLERAGATYEYRATEEKILVPRADQTRLFAMLAENRTLPSDATLGFADLIKDSSSFTSQDEAQWRRNVALQNTVARIISQFTGVRSAKVLLDPSNKRGLGQAQTLPSASVFLEMRPGAIIDSNFVMAVAAGVAGVNSNLSRDRVEVIDMTTNQRFTVPDPNDPISIDELGKRRENEKHATAKIREVLRHIPGLFVTVHADLVTDSTRRESDEYSGEPAVRKETVETTNEREADQPTGPGVVPNTAQALNTAGPSRNREQETRDTEFADQRNHIREVTQNVPFVPRRFTAAVNVPRAYFEAIYKGQPDAADPPDPAALETLIENEKGEIKKLVKTAIDAVDEDVAVTVYHGGFAMGPGGALVAASSLPAPGETSAVMQYVESYGSQAGLGALAVMSLVMMLMMVRRASEGPALPEDKPLVPDADEDEMGILATESAPVGQAAATAGMLVAQEIDDGTLRTREIVDQLGKMVTDDPESAAELVERWIQKDE